ncbi:MAG: class I SAM-dependent methyltransferase [Hyphomicrobiaceae bacterium]
MAGGRAAGGGHDWEREYSEGRWDFLEKPHEQLRHAVMASLIGQHARGEVIDLGAGRCPLLAWLRPGEVTRYIGVDLSATALAAMPASPIPSETITTSIEAFPMPDRPVGALVCAEALYFLDDPVGVLKAKVEAAQEVAAVVVSLVVPRPDKPNWKRNADRIWQGLEATGWPLVDKVRVGSEAAGIAWDVAVYRTG